MPSTKVGEEILAQDCDEVTRNGAGRDEDFPAELAGVTSRLPKGAGFRVDIAHVNKPRHREEGAFKINSSRFSRKWYLTETVAGNIFLR